MFNNTKIFLIYFSALLLSPGFLFAQVPVAAPVVDVVEGGAAYEIKKTFESVTAKVKESSSKLTDEALDSQLREIITPVFNFDDMARRCLGPEWNNATADQQKEFVSLFSDLLGHTYLKRIKRNALTSKLSQISESTEDNLSMVKTVVSTDAEDDIRIDYRLKKYDGKWRIYDVVIEKVGLVSNYRNEFPGIVRKDGFDALLIKLREKQASKKS